VDGALLPGLVYLASLRAPRKAIVTIGSMALTVLIVWCSRRASHVPRYRTADGMTPPLFVLTSILLGLRNHVLARAYSSALIALLRRIAFIAPIWVDVLPTRLALLHVPRSPSVTARRGMAAAHFALLRAIFALIALPLADVCPS